MPCSPMTVRSALQLINRFIGEDDFDHDTQFCLAWFEQHGWAEGKYGDADVLARAKGTSVGGLSDAGARAAAAVPRSGWPDAHAMASTAGPFNAAGALGSSRLAGPRCPHAVRPGSPMPVQPPGHQPAVPPLWRP